MQSGMLPHLFALWITLLVPLFMLLERLSGRWWYAGLLGGWLSIGCVLLAMMAGLGQWR